MTSGVVFLVGVLSVCIFFVDGQSYGNVTYNELRLVKDFHLIPHFDSNFKLCSKKFDLDPNSIDNTYAESVIVLPILITCAIFLALCIFELSLCCRLCCKCCTCLESGGEPSRNSITTLSAWTYKISNSREDLKIIFFVFLGLTGLAVSFVIWAMIYIMNGNDKSIDATNSLQHTTSSLDSSGNLLESYGQAVYNLSALAIPTCGEAEIVQSSTLIYLDYVADFNDIIDPIPEDLNNLEDFLKKWGEKTAESVVWNAYGAFLLLLAFMLAAYCCKSKGVARVALGCSIVVAHISLVLFCLLMIALTVLADFCMAPTDNTLSLTPDSALDVATYYGTCNGTNPFASPLADAYAAVEVLNTSLAILTDPGGNCEGNPYLVACYPIVEEMYDELNSIDGNIACEPIQEQWADVFNKAVCHDYFLGLYVLFYVVAFTLVLLFIVMITWSLLYQYFGRLWETDEHIVDVMSVDSFGNALLPGSTISQSQATEDDLKYDSSLASSSRGDNDMYVTTISSVHYKANADHKESFSDVVTSPRQKSMTSSEDSNISMTKRDSNV